MHYKTDIKTFSAQCSEAGSFTELVPFALAELEKFPEGAEIVCGPISTGGRGIESNFKVFGGTIKALQEQGRPIFSQIPYEERIFTFRKQWQESDPANAGQYYMPILDEFYEPIFATGRIRKAWFIPGWESSFGARWERERLVGLGAEIEDLTDDWVDTILAAAGSN